ncbi:MAG: 3D domain-containing protein [Candidatus Baltobacteraceae bacterium]
MIRRARCAALFVVALSGYPAAAPAGTSPYVTAVTWHRDGVVTWERTEQRTIAPPTIHRLSATLAPGQAHVVAAGSSGLREVRVACAQRDGGPVHKQVLSSTVVRKPSPRIVAEGIGSGSSLAAFEARGVAHMAYLARDAMQMVATAYTANCAGCGGMTAIGRRAGHGIVAVDPRVIPLGTRLYIPGYGMAVAGDTGGAIVGNRIDLGFDSWRDAMLFGRRDITVYRLK